MKGIWFRLAKLIKEADWINCIPENIKSGVTVYNEYTRQDVTGAFSGWTPVAVAHSETASGIYNIYNDTQTYVAQNGTTTTYNFYALDGMEYMVVFQADYSSTTTASAFSVTSGTVLDTFYDSTENKTRIYYYNSDISVTKPKSINSGFIVYRR